MKTAYSRECLPPSLVGWDYIVSAFFRHVVLSATPVALVVGYPVGPSHSVDLAATQGLLVRLMSGPIYNIDCYLVYGEAIALQVMWPGAWWAPPCHHVPILLLLHCCLNPWEAGLGRNSIVSQTIPLC